MPNLSINLLYDSYENPEAAARSVYPFLDRAPFDAVQVTTGARKEQGRTFALQLKQRYPTLDAILRLMPDENPALYQRYPNPADYVASVAPWVSGGLMLGIGNEAGVSDLAAQNAWYAPVVEGLGKLGIRSVTPSVQTHNRFAAAAFDATYRMLAKYGGMFSLHYYSDPANGLPIDPIHETVETYCATQGIRIQFAITELGYAKWLGSFAGYNGRIASDDYAAQLVAAARRWPRVRFFVYGWGKQDPWGDFDISGDKTVQDAIVAHNLEVVTPALPDVPTVPGTATVMRVRATSLGLRIAHGAAASLVRRLDVNEQVAIYLDTTTALIDKYQWTYIETSKDKGWTAIRGAWGESFDSIDTPVFKMIRPVGCSTVISSMFGVPRDYDGDGVFDDKHEGLDLTHAHADCTPLILAGADGVVDTVSSAGDYGNHVKLKHVVGTETYITWYCHLQAIFVAVGQTVKQGDFIGVMGNTGNSSGMHCHVNVQHVGHGLSGFVIPDATDPLLYFAA